jgi:hypothetical protein
VKPRPALPLCRRGAARGSTLRVLIALALALPLAPRAGLADADERRARTHRTQLVVVDYPHSAFVDPELHAAVRELLSRVQLQVVSATQASEGEVIAYAQIDVGSEAVTISVEDARGNTPRARRSVLRGDSSAMLRETVAHVLLGLLEPLAEADQPAAPQSLHDGADAAPSRERSLRPQLGLHGGPVQLAQDSWSGRFVAAGALVWDSRFSPALALDASMAVPVTVREQREQGVEAQVLLAGGRARVRFSPFEFTHAALDAALSAGADVFSVRPEDPTSGTEIKGTSRKVQPVVGIALGARTALHPRFELVLGLGVDVDLMPRSWSVAEGESLSPVFETRTLRPYATLGIDWLARAPSGQVGP